MSYYPPNLDHCDEDFASQWGGWGAISGGDTAKPSLPHSGPLRPIKPLVPCPKCGLLLNNSAAHFDGLVYLGSTAFCPCGWKETPVQSQSGP